MAVAKTDFDYAILGQLAYELYYESKVQALAHFYAADYWGGSYLFLGLIITGLSATVSASIFSDYAFLAVFAAILSLFLVVISSVSTFLNPDQRTNSHVKARTIYLGLADKAQLLFRVDLVFKKQKLEELHADYVQLLKEMDEARKSSPRIPKRHIEKASKAVTQTLAKP